MNKCPESFMLRQMLFSMHYDPFLFQSSDQVSHANKIFDFMNAILNTTMFTKLKVNVITTSG